MKQLRLISKRSDCIVTLDAGYNASVFRVDKSFPQILTSIPNPVILPENYTPEKKEKMIVFIGRLDKEQKSPQFLIPIWRILHPQHQDWHLYIIGNGACLQELKEQSRSLNNIHFMGQCNPEPYLKRASMLFLTSTYEGFGMVLIESMSYGVIPFAFSCSEGVRGIIDDERDGMLIKPFNTKAYAQKASSLMGDELRRATMSDCAQRNVRRYSIQSVTDQWEALFNRLQR